MVNSIIITFNAPSNLENMNVFEIGTNKHYFNKGKEEYIIQEKIIPSIKNLSNFLTNHLEPTNVYFSGILLTYLNKTSKETINLIQKIIDNPQVNLVLSNYYCSSLKILTQKEFEHQINEHKKILKELFNKKVNTFISFDNNINTEQIAVLNQNKIKNIILLPKNENGIFSCKTTKDFLICDTKNQIKILHSENPKNNLIQNEQKTTNNIIHLNESFFYEKNNFIDLNQIVDLNDLISNHKTSNHKTSKECPLKEHVKDEMSTLYDLITKINDETSMQEWRLLSSNINLLNDENNKQHYENYISYMNILNDFCHKIKTGLLLKEGKNITEPKLVNNPTKYLKEVLVKLD